MGVASRMKSLRLSDEEIARLERLARDLDCSEGEALRWAMLALEAVLKDGLTSGARRGKDGEVERIWLSDARSRHLGLRRRPDGSFGYPVLVARGGLELAEGE